MKIKEHCLNIKFVTICDHVWHFCDRSITRRVGVSGCFNRWTTTRFSSRHCFYSWPWLYFTNIWRWSWFKGGYASTDSEECDIAEDDLDDVHHQHHYLDDYAFKIFLDDNDKAVTAKKKAAEHRRQQKERRQRREYEDLTSLAACEAVLKFECPHLNCDAGSRSLSSRGNGLK